MSKDSETHWVPEKWLEHLCYGLYEGGYPSDRPGNEPTTRDEAEECADDSDCYVFEITVTRHERSSKEAENE